MIVFDTFTIIWDALDSSKLSSKAKKAIKDSEDELIVCDISIWEISLLIKRKRIILDDTASGFLNLVIQSRNFQIQPITPEIAEISVNFNQEINNDLADRIIAATSIFRNAAIVTADQNLIKATFLETIW